MPEDEIHIRRSTLVVPANRRSMIEKAIGTDADVLMLDMEDAVAYTDEEKTLAQRVIVESRHDLDFKGKEVIVRVNALDSRWFDDDLKACLDAHPRAVVIPKVTGADDLRHADRRLMMLRAPSDLRFWVGLETVSAVMRSDEIAQASTRVEVLRFGFGDYTVSMQGQFTDGLDLLLFPLTKVLATARMLGLQATGPAVVFGNIKRLDLVRNNALLLRQLGFDGATVIHPSHIAEIHAVFTPTEKEIEWARQQVAALEQAEDKAAVVIDGRLVEMVNIKLARRTLAIAQKIGLG